MLGIRAEGVISPSCTDGWIRKLLSLVCEKLCHSRRYQRNNITVWIYSDKIYTRNVETLSRHNANRVVPTQKCLFTPEQHGSHLGPTPTVIRLSGFFSVPAGSDVARRLGVLGE